MKNKFIYLTILLAFCFTGCAQKMIETKQSVIGESKEGIITVVTEKDVNIKYSEKSNSKNNTTMKKEYKANNLMLRDALKLISKKTLEKNKTNFIMINNDTNNLLGFPINTYSDLNKFCLNYDRDTSLEINCSVFKEYSEINSAVFRFVILDKEDYKVASFNAKQVLEELSKESK